MILSLSSQNMGKENESPYFEWQSSRNIRPLISHPWESCLLVTQYIPETGNSHDADAEEHSITNIRFPI